jgi:hypothetical protein
MPGNSKAKSRACRAIARECGPDELTQDALSLQVDNLKRGRGPEDLLFQVLLDWGVDLAFPISEEQIFKALTPHTELKTL